MFPMMKPLEHTANVIIHLEQIMRKTQPRHTIVRMPYREYISNREASFLRQEQQAKTNAGNTGKKWNVSGRSNRR